MELTVTKRKGFSLTELLVVIAIISLVAGLLFVVFGRTRAAAKNSVCLNNLEQIGKAVHLYANDNDDMVPPFLSFGGPGNNPPPGGAALRAALASYKVGADLWRCPLAAPGWDKDRAAPGDQANGLYVLPGMTAALFRTKEQRFQPPKLSQIDQPSNQVYLEDNFVFLLSSNGHDTASPHGDGFGNALFFDSHVKRNEIIP